MYKFIISLLFAAWACPGLAQVGTSCDLHFGKSTGTVYTYATFDRKGAQRATTTQRVVDAQPGRRVMEAQATLTKDQKTLPAKSYTLTCDGRTTQLNVASFLPPVSDDGEWELRSTADSYLTYPATLAAGATLSEANYKVEGYQNGSQAGTVTVKLYNRRVTGQASVTVPAGTYTAWVIESEATSVFQKTGGKPYTFNTRSKEYYVAGLGWVKTENLLKTGKALGYTHLVSVR